MKIYIKTLTKEKRQELKEKFLTKDESIIYKKAHRVFTISLIGIIFAVCSVIYDVLYKTGTWSYVLDGLLFAFSGIFAYRTSILKDKELNKYALKEKNTK